MAKRLLISSKSFLTLLIFYVGFSCFYGFSQAGANDPLFNTADPGFGIGDGADNWVDATVLLPDGKYLIGGAFAKYNDVRCEGIMRINHDGSIDPTWNVGGTGATTSTYGEVYNIDVQPDGKIIIVGDFTKYNGVTRNRIARLNADGTLDLSFNPGTGLNNLTSEIVLLPDGKMLVGGSFTTVNGTPCVGIARLNSDGSLDPTFNSGGSGVSSAGSSYSNTVCAITVLTDGRIYIGGAFTYYNGNTRIREAILYADGSLDPTFVTGSGTGGPNATVQDAIQQPDGKLVIIGDFNNYNGIARNFIARINLDGTLDMTLNPSYSSSIGFNNGLRTVNILPDGDILASGQASAYSGTTISKIARLNADGSLDAGFSTGTGFTSPGYSTYVDISLPQADGKILVGGTFKYLNGQYYRNLVRLNADGTLDPSFNSGSGFNSGAVNSVKELPDGTLIVGGEFNRFNGVTREGLVKLNADGTLNTSFPITNFATGGDFRCVRKVIIQPDGKILIAGSFYGINGSSRKCIARLNADGTLETAFSPNVTISDTIHAMVLQPDGKIIIGGKFSAVDGVSRSNIARLNADGTLDATFTVGSGFLLTVRSLALQSDGKVLVGGDFTYYASTAINRIARLNTNGTLDATFNVGNGCNNVVNSIAVQPDGKILIGGKFNTFNSTIAPRLTRVLTNGSPDPSFAIGTGFNTTVSEIYLKDDGKIFVGGQFTTFNGNARKGVICLNPGGSENTSFQFGTGVTANTDVRSILQLSNNKMLIGGDFTSYNEIGRNRMAWLNSPANTYNTITQTVCNSYTGPSGTNYTSSGTYSDVIPNAAGTDSIITLQLTINPTIYHSDVVTSCGPYTWSNGVTYFSNTTVSQTLSSQAGCDSIVTLQLTVHQPSSGIQVVSACDSYVWINGVIYYASTSTPTYTLTNSQGCDSIVTLHLTIHVPTSGTQVVSACESYTWIDGITYSSNNSSATYHLQNSFGCDSVVNLQLTILQSSGSVEEVTACGEYTWADGITYTSSTNSPTRVLPNALGCDSVISLHLTILPLSGSVEEVSACGEYTWINGVTYTASTNSPTLVFPNAAGCDSVISLHLTIHPLPAVSALENGDGTISASGFGTYQWIDCATNTILVNETNALFTPTSDGSYAVIITDTEGCEDTSSCIVIDYLGLSKGVLSNASIHPNPTVDLVTIDFPGGKAQLTVHDAQGKSIFSKEIATGEKVSLQHEEAGVYIFTLDTESGKKIARVVKW
ncbi:T9SS type A sorting domain-containing protein [Fluviicola sp.]|uniref:T9SS type A sorting domain-containing protein n=1 Tax=Fluviicola sp. TaxID=1917219 RepID=UPI0031DEB499